MPEPNGETKKAEPSIRVTSIYGLETRKALVQIQTGDHIVLMEPVTARELALSMLEAAEAAESDAFIVAFAITRAGADLTNAAKFLAEWRTFRRTVVEAASKGQAQE